jgi:hypothetical protein
MEYLFRSEVQEEGIEGEWHLFFPSETAAFIDLSKSFDLTILGQLSPETRSSGFPPDEIVVATGRPILVIPYAGTFDNIGRRALVAWDGTREAVAGGAGCAAAPRPCRYYMPERNRQALSSTALP